MFNTNNNEFKTDFINMNYNYDKIFNYDNIKNALIKLKNKIIFTIEKINSNEPKIDELIKDLKKYCNTTLNIFKKFFEIYKEEYYQFNSIKRMLFYILDNKSLLNHISFINEILISFFNLIETDLSKYLKKQKEFNIKLESVEEKFYTEIYKPTDSYNEKFLSDNSNSLLNLTKK